MHPKDLNDTLSYYHLVMDVWPPGDPVRAQREDLASHTLSGADRDALPTLDRVLLSAAVDGDCLPELYDDDPAQPVQDWWWHLGTLREDRYPLELLPSELRETFTEAQTERKAHAAAMQAIEVANYAIPFGAGDEWRRVREDAEAVIDPYDRKCLTEADAVVLDRVACDEPLWPGLFDDAPTQPPERWWWHLGAIRFGCHPIERLAPELRAAVIDAGDLEEHPSSRNATL